MRCYAPPCRSGIWAWTNAGNGLRPIFLLTEGTSIIPSSPCEPQALRCVYVMQFGLSILKPTMISCAAHSKSSL